MTVRRPVCSNGGSTKVVATTKTGSGPVFKGPLRSGRPGVLLVSSKDIFFQDRPVESGLNNLFYFHIFCPIFKLEIFCHFPYM
jgi:hypothetical protein